MRLAFDTNILVYAEGADDTRRRDIVLDLLSGLPHGAVVIPIQVLGELFNVLVRKAGRSRASARASLLNWRDHYLVSATTPEVLVAAADLATDHGLQIWDAVVLSSASQAGCRVLLSEDMQNGFTWGGATVIDPFATPRHAWLDVLPTQSGDG